MPERPSARSARHGLSGGKRVPSTPACPLRGPGRELEVPIAARSGCRAQKNKDAPSENLSLFGCFTSTRNHLQSCYLTEAKEREGRN